ncbi:hypothetical protein XENTR_v10015722 [Xenopus tropicalis]|nr:hypothetical protein XENTR_v10015722 [Xenopus tropicalis]
MLFQCLPNGLYVCSSSLSLSCMCPSITVVIILYYRHYIFSLYLNTVVVAALRMFKKCGNFCLPQKCIWDIIGCMPPPPPPIKAPMAAISKNIPRSHNGSNTKQS